MSTRSTAMKVRVDLAIKTDPANIDDLMKTSNAIQTLKIHAADLGFVLTVDVSAKMGTYEFPPEQPVDETLTDPVAEEG